MLAVIQFPIADLRRLQGLAGAPPSPAWPPRTAVPAQFMKHFGAACPRYRGVDRAWVDEASYCTAERALRFPQLPEGAPSPQALRCAFRRLLSDGETVARVEVGLGFSTDAPPAAGRGHPADPSAAAARLPLSQVLDAVLRVRTVVPESDAPRGAPVAPKPLIRQGRSLAKLYLHATTAAAATSTPAMAECVAVGAPVCLIEHPDAATPLPPHFGAVACALPPGLALAFGQHPTPWGLVDTWVVLGPGPREAVRGLRLCLLRLHAEQQVLASVLQRWAAGQIAWTAQTAAADALQAYLNRATRVIERQWWGSIPQSQILAAFDALHGAGPGFAQQQQLAQRLEDVRRQVRVKVERLQQRLERVVNIFDGGTYVDQSKSISIGGNATGPVVIADSIKESFNTVANTSNEDVKRLMEELLRAVQHAAETSPDRNAVALAQHAESLSKELAKPQPRRAWYEVSLDGLKEAAEAVGELGAPIVEATRKLLPLLVTLWP